MSADTGEAPSDEKRCGKCGKWHSGFALDDSPTTYCFDCHPAPAAPTVEWEKALQELVEETMAIAEPSEGGVIFHYRDPRFRAARNALSEAYQKVLAERDTAKNVEEMLLNNLDARNKEIAELKGRDPTPLLRQSITARIP